MNEVQRKPQVTVIALCFNHARFLHECLDSIASQSIQDFQLIITDDCSEDDSADMIQAWIAAHRPDTTLIRHAKNVGVCKTLNEALSHSRGEFISMIATDDVWESTKIEQQLAAMREATASVAVVYSDATRVNKAGKKIAKDFIQAHAPDCIRQSGRLFSELANRNFIPAMATLIRRQALVDVGLYDEQLTYEDYDMWLRLAARYDFVYYPATLARYRIVYTSIVRTVFVQPTRQHYFTLYLICSKWLPSKLLSPVQKKDWAERMWDAAYGLYRLNDSRASGCLWRAARYSRRPRALLLAVASTLGITRAFALRLSSFYRKV